MPIITPKATTHHGLVISERECNMHDDSDFYATIWNTDEGCAEEIMWGTTRGAMGPMYGYNCQVDAEPWVLDAYARWKARDDVRHAGLVAIRLAELNWLRFAGDVVKVVRGRKCPKGYTGEVVSVREVYNPYASAWTHRYSRPVKTMLLVSDGTSTRNVESDYTEVVQRSPALMQQLFDAA
jgi:hypothetical protein